jgi:hypothetical protein
MTHGETFEQHIAHLERMRGLKVGDRVRVRLSGRTGTVIRRNVRHNGWRILWDEPVFGVTAGDVLPHNLDFEEDRPNLTPR